MSALSETLDELIEEARTLRAGIGAMPGTEAAPVDVHEYLLDARRRLDRVEQILSSAIRVRARVRRAHAEASAEVEDAWDEAITRIRSSPVRRNDEYSSAKERAAEANLHTIAVRRAARLTADALSRAEEAVEVLRLLHKGLDAARYDALVLLRLVQFESHLER